MQSLWATALITTALACGSPDAAQSAPLAAVFSRQNVFAIPFVVPLATDKANAPHEIRLLVRTDPSAAWQLASRANPKAGRFQFRAPHDGTYWFAIRTIDPRGQPAPPAQPTAGLKVVVDTRPPGLVLKARRLTPRGEVEAEWQAEDAGLDLKSLQIQFQVGSSGAWTDVAAAPARMWNRAGSVGGQIAMATGNSNDPITVRASISDQAGNRSVTQALIPAALSTPAVAGRPATGRPPRVPHPHVSYRTVKPPVTPAPRPEVRPDGSTPWPPDQRTDQPLATRPPQATKAAVAAVHPPVAHEVRAPIVPTGSSPASTAGTGPMVVPSTSFELVYPVDSPATADIIKVDLWGTRDGGQTWISFGTDLDRQSPFQVTVPGKGLYGFRFAIRATNMTLGERPHEGDTPDISVVVQ